jgi:phosphonate transport system ATP-binding protein
MLTVENLVKVFSERVVALKGVSFAVEPGTFTALLGPSGAGKTTLLRCILQLVRPSAGQVWFEGRNLAAVSGGELRRLRTGIAMVAQQFNLVRRRSALVNCLGGRLQQLPLWRCLLQYYPRALLAEGLVALERVQLLDAAFQRAEQLSGGQQQRVALARALTQKARLLLADEPVASLDPESAQRMLDLLRSLCRQEGLTVLCSLHQVAFAQQYADRALGLRDGTLMLDKPAAQLDATDIDCIYKPATP